MSRRSWREASCTAHTCPNRWHSALIGPAGGQNSCQACWTSSPVSPYKWARCWCQNLMKKREGKCKKTKKSCERQEHFDMSYFFFPFTSGTLRFSVCVCVCECFQWRSWDEALQKTEQGHCQHQQQASPGLRRVCSHNPQTCTHTRTHTHTPCMREVLTSSGGIKAVRGFEVSVGIEVENPKPVLQSGSQTVELCISASCTQTQLNKHEIMRSAVIITGKQEMCSFLPPYQTSVSVAHTCFC